MKLPHISISRHLLVAGLYALALLAVPTLAHATLLNGTTINSHFDAIPGFPGYAGPTSTVAPGTVSPYPGINSNGIFSVTYADTSIQILSAGGDTPFGSGFSFNGIVFDDTGVIFSGVTIDPASTLSGFTAANLSFTANKIMADFGDLTFLADQQLVLDLTGSVNTPSVPEPSTLGLFGLGLLGLGAMRRRRRDS
jgi:hypothetical protein